MRNEKRSFYLRNMIPKIASLPMILVAVGVFIGCSFWTIFYSFTNSRLLPNSRFVGLNQYERLWATPRWLESVANIAIYGILALVLTLVLGFLLAVLLDQKIRAESVFRTILLYPYALSFVVTGLVWQWILNPSMGLQNVVRGWGWESFTFDPLYNPDIVLLALLLAGLWHGVGFVMVICLAGLRNIDEDVWKAVRVDGIPMWKSYLFVIVPMMKPVFATVTILVSAGIVRLYDLVVALTNGGPGISSEVPAKYVIDFMFRNQNLGQGFAASTMMLLAVLVLLIPGFLINLVRRYRRG